jgi:hypothetical protein
MCELCYLVLQFHHSTDLILLFFSDFQQCSLKYQYSGSDKHQIPVEVYGRNQLSNISMPSSSTCLDEDILQTLHNDYKSNFNEDEWNKICRFECQFQRKYSEVFDFYIDAFACENIFLVFSN